MRNKKACLAAICILLIMTKAVRAYASEPIRYVRLEMEYDMFIDRTDPRTIDITSYQDEYDISFGIDNAKGYRQGEEVRARVMLAAREGYSFRDIKKASCKMDGAEPERMEVISGGKGLTLWFIMPPLKYQLKKPVGLSLSADGTADWESVRGADSYEVTVQKMSDMGQRDYVDSFNVIDSTASLYEYMYSVPGDYLYTVRARSKKEYALDSPESELPVSRSVLISSRDIGYPPQILNEDGYAEFGYEDYARDMEVKIAGKHYYFGPDGKRQSGWVKVDGRWHYYMPESFERASGRIEVEGKAFYLDEESGDMVTGFVKEGIKERLYLPSGEKADGWVRYGKDIYYINPDGTRNYKQLIDGNNRTYLFDEEGRLIRGS